MTGRRGSKNSNFRNYNRDGRANSFKDYTETNFQSNSNDNEPLRGFSGFAYKKSTINTGDHVKENEIPNGIFEFVISHIETIDEFYIQLYSKNEEISNLNDQLQNEYENAPELTTYSIDNHQICLAQSSHKRWYRAIILSNTNSNKIKIRFIDYGDVIELDRKSIRQLKHEFCSAPPYAYCCMLKNIENKIQSQSSILFFFILFYF